MMSYVKDVFRVANAPIDFEIVHLDPSTDNYDDLYNVQFFLTKIQVFLCFTSVFYRPSPR